MGVENPPQTMSPGRNPSANQCYARIALGIAANNQYPVALFGTGGGYVRSSARLADAAFAIYRNVFNR